MMTAFDFRAATFAASTLFQQAPGLERGQGMTVGGYEDANAEIINSLLYG